MWFICALVQQVGKAGKVIRNEKKNFKKNWSSKFYLVISICSFPKTVPNLRIAKSYFTPRADNGEGGAFVVEDG